MYFNIGIFSSVFEIYQGNSFISSQKAKIGFFNIRHAAIYLNK